MRSVVPSVWLLCLTMSVVAGCAGEAEDFDEEDGDDPPYGTTEAAVSGRWSPPRTRQTGTVTQAGAWNGGRSCTGGLRPGARSLGAALDRKFSAVTKIGGYACRRNTASSSQMSMHGTGRAIDIFVSRSGGTAVANYLVSNANDLGVQLVIWNRTLWKVTPGGGAARAYGGPNPHTDHIHAELTSSGAARTRSGLTGEVDETGFDEAAGDEAAGDERDGDERDGD